MHNWFFIIGEPAADILLLCVNVDRVIAVGKPLVDSAKSCQNLPGLLQTRRHIRRTLERSVLRVPSHPGRVGCS